MQRRATKIRRKRGRGKVDWEERRNEVEKEREEEGSEEAVALRRVATSCTKGSDRTSYLTRACCASSVPTHLSAGPPFSSLSLSLSLRSPSAFPSFPVSAFGVPPLYSFPRPGARRLESLFIFISFGLVCRLAARHRDYRVPATHLGNSGGPLSAARSSPTTSFPLKRARDPRGMTTDGVRPGASRANLPSPPAAPRPSSSSSSSSFTFFFPRRFSGTVLPRYFIPSRPLASPFSFIFSLRRLVPALSHHRACSVSLFPFLFYLFSSRFVSFYPFCVSSVITPFSLLLPPSFLSFRCCFCSLFSVFRLHSLPVFLSLSPSLPCSPPLAH